MSEWVDVKWDEVVEIINGKNQKAVEDVEGKYPIYGSGGIMGYANDYLCEEDTVIIGRKGSINKPIYVEEKFWNVDTAFGLVAWEDKLIPKYLYYFCLQFNFEKLNTTVTIPSLTKSNLLNILMPLPPIETQKKIAEVLDKAQELIDKRKEQIDLLDDFIQSVFIDMFGDPVSNPKGWNEIKVKNVCKSIVGGGTPSKSNSNYYNGEIPWVTPKDMKSRYIRDSIDHITKDAVLNSSVKMIPSDSILMVIRSGILKRFIPIAINKCEVTVNQDMKAFIVNTEITTTQHLMFVLVLMQSLLLKHVRGVTADNIEFSLIKELPIPVPPLALQNEFAQIVAKTEQQRELMEKSLTEMENNFNSLMQRAFRGELF